MADVRWPDMPAYDPKIELIGRLEKALALCEEITGLAKAYLHRAEAAEAKVALYERELRSRDLARLIIDPTPTDMIKSIEEIKKS